MRRRLKETVGEKILKEKEMGPNENGVGGTGHHPKMGRVKEETEHKQGEAVAGKYLRFTLTGEQTEGGKREIESYGGNAVKNLSGQKQDEVDRSPEEKRNSDAQYLDEFAKSRKRSGRATKLRNKNVTTKGGQSKEEEEQEEESERKRKRKGQLKGVESVHTKAVGPRYVWPHLTG